MHRTPNSAESAISRQSAWAPLRNQTFRKLWIAWLLANVCMVMFEVTAAWMMTVLSHRDLHVALVQTAATLPVLLMVLPFGAAVDMIDRRKWFFASQVWLSLSALCLAVSAAGDWLSPHVLLALVFANGIGMAMRWPAFVSIVPEVVSATHLSQALALHAMAVNVSRVVAPLLAGLMIAAFGGASAFASCVLLSLIGAKLIWDWQYSPDTTVRQSVPLWASMKAGIRHALHTRPLIYAMIQIFVGCLQVFALVALLPAVAKRLDTGPGAGAYTWLMSCMGIGAIAMGLCMPLLKGKFHAQQVATASSIAHVAAVFVLALSSNVWEAAAAMLIAGGSWLVLGNAINVSAQLSLPNHVRARGMSIFMIAAMSGSAAGSSLFGALADVMSAKGSLLILASIVLALTWIVRRWPLYEHGSD